MIINLHPKQLNFVTYQNEIDPRYTISRYLD